MKGMMLTSRLGALVFVGVAMIAAAVLVGTEDHNGALLDAADQIEQQQNDGTEQEMPTAAPTPKPAPSPSSIESTAEDPVLEFTPDEDLVVDPTGFDPTPVITDPAEGEEVVVETVGEVSALPAQE